MVGIKTNTFDNGEIIKTSIKQLLYLYSERIFKDFYAAVYESAVIQM